jgi:iron complex outermembrane receptor protein
MEISRRVLVGTSLIGWAGLVWSQEPPSVPVAAAVSLPEVVVSAPALPPAGTLRAAGRRGADAMESPQSTSTVASEWLQRQGARTLDDALSQVPGITDTGTAGTLFMRGFSASVMSNGTLNANPMAVQMAPLIGIERIDVIKGPEAIVAGQAAGYGGVVDVVTKKARAQRVREVALQTGSNGRFGVGLDLGDALTSDGRWSARLVASSDREQQDSVGYDGPYQAYVASALGFQDKLSGTDVQLRHEYIDQGLRNFWSVYYDPLSTQLGQQGQALRLGDNARRSAEALSQATSLEWEQQLGSQWRMGLRLQHDVANVRFAGGLVGFVVGYPSVFGVALGGEQQWSKSSLKLDLNTAFETGWLRHRLQLAVDAEQGDALQSQASPAALGLYSALNGQLLRALRPAGALATVADNAYVETGAMLMDQVSWDRWHAVVGVRQVSYRPDNRLTGVAQSYNATLPSLGLVYRANDTQSWYGNAARAFRANTGLLEFATGQQVAPESAQQWELGLKQQTGDKRLTWTVAAYQIEQQNRAVTDVTHSTGPFTYYLNAQGVVSQGLEAELSGQWSERLGVRATYAFGTVTFPAGQPTAPFARHIWGLNTTYDLQQIGRGAWLGASLQGRSEAQNFDSGLKQNMTSPAALRFDLYGGYRAADWTLSLGVKNVADRRNYTLSSGTNGVGNLVQPRQVWLSLAYRY